ncbi:MAG: MFS transporter [Actinomycetota bacterium]|nr:MFS transporter [Actinomycetota bacterium]
MPLLLTALAVGIAIIIASGGRLSRLADIQLRGGYLLVAAMALQVALMLHLLPADQRALQGAVHLFSYGLSGAFVVANFRVPGLPLLGFGGLLNFLPIAANGGVMPASLTALERAGMVAVPADFSNSAALTGPRLSLLGDTFALPASWPIANVFSVGDILIVAGAIWGLWRFCGTHPLPSSLRPLTELGQHPDFLRLWGGQAVSHLGDWVFAVAVATSLAGQENPTRLLATLLVLQVAPAAVVGLLGAPLIDRFPRRRLMIAADLVRAVAVGSLVLAGTPSMVHLGIASASLGVMGSLFQPSFAASLPNLVPRERLVAANSLVSATFHVAVMVGPMLGAVMAMRLGSAVAFGVNAATFGVSALLVWSARVPDSPAAAVASRPLTALREGLSYSWRTPIVRGVLSVTCLAMLASAVRSPVELTFVQSVLGRSAATLGLLGGAWGAGMVVGSVAAPAVARRWAREQVLTVSVVVVGLAVIAASQTGALGVVVALWIIAGAGNATGAIAYETLLQERTPDAIRGRVLGASEAIMEGSYLAGVFLAGWLAPVVGPRVTFGVSGLGFVAAGVVSVLVIGRTASCSEAVGHKTTEAPTPAATR